MRPLKAESFLCVFAEEEEIWEILNYEKDFPWGTFSVASFIMEVDMGKEPFLELRSVPGWHQQKHGDLSPITTREDSFLAADIYFNLSLQPSPVLPNFWPTELWNVLF